jgi:hypothetical protein
MEDPKKGVTTQRSTFGCRIAADNSGQLTRQRFRRHY